MQNLTYEKYMSDLVNISKQLHHSEINFIGDK